MGGRPKPAVGEGCARGDRGTTRPSEWEVDDVIWLLVLLLLLLAIGGGVVVSKALFLILVVALALALFGVFSGSAT
jgi:hypothetical protein